MLYVVQFGQIIYYGLYQFNTKENMFASEINVTHIVTWQGWYSRYVQSASTAMEYILEDNRHFEKNNFFH